MELECRVATCRGEVVVWRGTAVDAVPPGDHRADDRHLQDRSQAHLEELRGFIVPEFRRTDELAPASAGDRPRSRRSEVVDPRDLPECREQELPAARPKDRDRERSVPRRSDGPERSAGRSGPIGRPRRNARRTNGLLLRTNPGAPTGWAADFDMLTMCSSSEPLDRARHTEHGARPRIVTPDRACHVSAR